LTAPRDSLRGLIRLSSAALDDLVLKFEDEDEELPRARVALLLKHFSKLYDEREPRGGMYPLSEVLLLLTCATICSCKDFDEIVPWGEHHLPFLQKELELQ